MSKQNPRTLQNYERRKAAARTGSFWPKYIRRAASPSELETTRVVTGTCFHGRFYWEKCDSCKRSATFNLKDLAKRLA